GTAYEQFKKLRDEKTMINFVFSNERVNTANGSVLWGLHQPHGTRLDKSYGPLKFDDQNQKFEGTVDIVKDDNGNEVYKEATITIYDKTISDDEKQDADLIDADITGVFVHEAEHDLDPHQVQAVKNGDGNDKIWHPNSLKEKERNAIQEVRAVQFYRNKAILIP
ncbi:MAG TPA: hypothetical protein VKB86_09340, partial [Pyrinomonadaceae bacterium]|nr:hypothetical protein [Pyrinomonadaceae bacterium]